MLLTGNEIIRNIEEGNIEIEPFILSRINPNSYNLTLHNELMIYTDEILDMKKDNKTERITIPEEGIVLLPGEFYLGRTVERTKTIGFAPYVEGRSSIGRLGISVHRCAAFGDNGFDGFWTLQITVQKPVRIYAGIAICQIAYNTLQGEESYYKSSKYQGSSDIVPSQIFKDFNKWG